MNQEMKTKDFYNRYGYREWECLDRTPYDRLNFLLHMDFMKDAIKEKEGLKVFDVGCGAGRFSIELVKMGCKVSMLDISEEQLKIAEKKLTELQLMNQVERMLVGSLADMNQVADDTYDIIICYGAPLNYLYDNYIDGIKELYRVTKPGGKVFVSVNSRLGVIHSLVGRRHFDIVDFMGNPEYWFIDQVVDEGNLPEHPKVEHPPRHMFEANELKEIFQRVGFNEIDMGSSPCIIAGLPERAEEISKNETAWETLVNLELKTYKKETTLDLGEFLMISGVK